MAGMALAAIMNYSLAHLLSAKLEEPAFGQDIQYVANNYPSFLLSCCRLFAAHSQRRRRINYFCSHLNIALTYKPHTERERGASFFVRNTLSA